MVKERESKMELYFLTRGKTNEIDEWVDWMKTRHLPFPIKRADGTIVNGAMECQLRPIQLWSFVFPRDSLDVVLNTMKLPVEGNPFVNGYNINPKVWALRKMLGCQPIPEKKDRKDQTSVMFLPFDRIKDMNIIGIGLREDGEISDTTHERI